MHGMSEEKIREVINRDIQQVMEKLKQHDNWENTRPCMWMTPTEHREFVLTGQDYSALILQRLQDEVDLDPRYQDSDWMVLDTLLDLIRKGLGVKNA